MLPGRPGGAFYGRPSYEIAGEFVGRSGRMFVAARSRKGLAACSGTEGGPAGYAREERNSPPHNFHQMGGR
jgi:hypothetical protein